MMTRKVKWLLIPVVILGVYFFSTYRWSDQKGPGPQSKKSWAAPVETAPIEQGAMELRRIRPRPSGTCWSAGLPKSGP